MVKGLSRFRKHFLEYEQEFVLIGGAACDEWFGARNLQFRATKDLDVVLLIEGLTVLRILLSRASWAFTWAW